MGSGNREFGYESWLNGAHTIYLGQEISDNLIYMASKSLKSRHNLVLDANVMRSVCDLDRLIGMCMCALERFYDFIGMFGLEEIVERECIRLLR